MLNGLENKMHLKIATGVKWQYTEGGMCVTVEHDAS